MKNTFLDSRTIPSFGVAGNFTGHLEQAGEDKDFLNIKTKEECAPKALFPTFIPECENSISAGNKVTPEYLHVYPFSCTQINFPSGEQKLQIEPECAVVCNVEWDGDNIKGIKPVLFGASNDCSIRKEGARKISMKKNWGKCSKGLSSDLIPVEDFSENGGMASYRIASFLMRGNDIFDYGEDSAIRDYSYIWSKLLDWCVEKLNFQEDTGPAENIHSYLLESGKCSQILISIGATRYTDFGEHNFLQNGDKAVVAVYDENRYDHEGIKKLLLQEGKSSTETAGVSILCQTVIV